MEAAGFDAYLVKPVTPEALLKVLALVMVPGTAQRALVTRHTIAEARESNPGSTPVSFTGRILLVEDNRVNQRIARAMLASLGLDTGRHRVDSLKLGSFAWRPSGRRSPAGPSGRVWRSPSGARTAVGSEPELRAPFVSKSLTRSERTYRKFFMQLPTFLCSMRFSLYFRLIFVQEVMFLHSHTHMRNG